MAATFAVSISANLCRADIKFETVPADAADGTAATFSVSIPEMPIVDVIAAFKKQTGIELQQDNNGFERQRGGPVVVTSLEFKNLDLNAALDRLGKAVSMRINIEGNASNPTYHIWPNGSGLQVNSFGDNMSRPQPCVELEAVSRNQTIPLSRDMGNVPLQIQLRAFSGKQSVSGPGQVNLIEATDDAGQPLTVPKRQGPVFFNNQGLQQVTSLSLLLVPAGPMPKTIRLIKGEAVLHRGKTMVRVTIDGFADKPVSSDYHGGKLTAGPIKLENNRATLTLRLDRDKMSQDDWNRIGGGFYSMGNQITATDAAGRHFENGGGGGGGSDRFYQTSLSFFCSGNGDAAPSTQPAAPTKLTWLETGETEELKIPFELKDIAIP